LERQAKRKPCAIGCAARLLQKQQKARAACWKRSRVALCAVA
jgi:hypothetical protein